MGAHTRDRASRPGSTPAARRGPAADPRLAQPSLPARQQPLAGVRTSSPTASQAAARTGPWSAGDNVQLATGQGDLQTNPLQMAVAYATLANGGDLVTPHVGMEIDDAAGRVLQEFEPRRSATSTSIPATAADDPRRPPRRRAEPRRHLVPVFGNFPIQSRARPGPRSDRRTPTSPGTRPWRRTDPKSAYRHGRDHGGRRLRRRTAAPAARQILEALYFRQEAARAAPSSEAERSEVEPRRG